MLFVLVEGRRNRLIPVVENSTAERPVVFAVRPFDWQIIDAGKSHVHQPIVVVSQFSLPYDRYQFPESSRHSYANRTAMRFPVKAQEFFAG